jgi:hemolysin activation/secretion protein
MRSGQAEIIIRWLLGGAKSEFTKLNINTSFARALPKDFQIKSRIKTQVSFSKLTPQEQFVLGGIDSVRGYPDGDFLADSAVIGNLELLIPAFFIPASVKLPYTYESLRRDTKVITFIDYGWGDKRGAPLDNGKKSVEYIGVGAGLRFHLFDQIYLRLEWGFPVGDASITEQGSSRFHFSVDFLEKLPFEAKRSKQAQS